MNLKFFILGLYVLVTIVQVQADLDLAEHNEPESPQSQKTKRQTPVENHVRGKRFNPFEIVGNIAKQPAELAVKEAFAKLFKSYSDPSKPFGPTYDTTWGSRSASPEAPANRRMNTDEVRTSSMVQPPRYPFPVLHRQKLTPPPRNYAYADEARMSTMIQPPPGQDGYLTYQTQVPAAPRNYAYADEARMSTMMQPPPRQDGYLTYQTQVPSARRSFGHSLEPNLPYQNYYDSNINGKQTVFGSSQPGYFPNPQGSMRRDFNASALAEQMVYISKEYPDKIERLIMELSMPKKENVAIDEISMRHGFLGDVFERPAGANIGMEGAPTGRRFLGSDTGVRDIYAKLLKASCEGLFVVISYIFGMIENSSMQEVYEMGKTFIKAFMEEAPRNRRLDLGPDKGLKDMTKLIRASAEGFYHAMRYISMMIDEGSMQEVYQMAVTFRNALMDNALLK